jgi:hypothetical protein
MLVCFLPKTRKSAARTTSALVPLEPLCSRSSRHVHRLLDAPDRVLERRARLEEFRTALRGA